jgi:hypothetical protein
MDEKKLIKRMLASQAFAASEGLRNLLDFLYENKHRKLNAADIEDEHFGRPVGSLNHDPGRSRVRISDLKIHLEKYRKEAPEDELICTMPNSSRSEGYQLHFETPEKALTATQRFWHPHLGMAEDVLVICGSHLFFFQPNGNIILRYYDFNVDEGNAETLKALKAAHPEGYAPTLEPWHNPYLSTGDVQAYESLMRWFHQESGVLIPRFTAREVFDRQIHNSSPILIGRPATNKFIAKILDSPKAAHLAYRIDSSRGAVTVANVRASEKASLSRYPMTKLGVVGPVPKREAVFGIVTRMRNPSGYGHVTIIVSDYYAMVNAKIAEALTNEKQTKVLLDRMELPPDSDFPESFEMLFSITLSPGNLEGEGHPELLCWRTYPTT